MGMAAWIRATKEPYMLTYIHTYIHTYIRIYIHTYRSRRYGHGSVD
jgi:hypothetical protein